MVRSKPAARGVCVGLMVLLFPNGAADTIAQDATAVPRYQFQLGQKLTYETIATGQEGQGQLPAIVYGSGSAPATLQLSE